MTQSISVDTSALVDGQSADAADVTTPLGDLKDALEDVLNGAQEVDTLLLNEITTPANPAAGTQKLYLKSADNTPYLLDSSGVETALGAGAVEARVDDLEGAGGDDYTADESSNFTTGSASFVDVDATMQLTITTKGIGPVLVHFSGTVKQTGSRIFLDVTIDGTPIGGDDGVIAITTNAVDPISFTRRVTGLSAGSHTFVLRWKTNGGTATMYAGAGTTDADVHPQFWVQEVASA